MVKSIAAPLTFSGTEFVESDGSPIRLRGPNIGGWLLMENFITGYAANEELMRSKVARAVGADRGEAFFEQLLTSFFADADAEFLAREGFNHVRINLNYRHFERDARPFEIIESGFRHLDRALEVCARHGIYAMLDLHAHPGHQNQQWHADNRSHVAYFWDHKHFQDRSVNIWEAIANRYKDNPWVSGYNLMNEPADETGQRVGPFYDRAVKAIRAIDPDHLIFLDGNTYSTDFSFFGDPEPGIVYALHDYVPSGFGRGGPYPGVTDGKHVDRDVVEETFLKRSEYARRTGTPIMVGEFSPIYFNDESKDVQRRQILEDQLEIYRRHNVSWASWMYKDLGRQGMVGVRADTPYRRRFDAFVAKKFRLSADGWGSDEIGPGDVTRPVRELMDREFPDYDPYPFGRREFGTRVMLNILFAEPLADEYADLLRGLDDSELKALAESFAFENCEVRTSLVEQLKRG